MKIILTGSSGLLGTDISRVAEKKNIILTGICRNPVKKNEISADIRTKDAIAKIANLDFDCIIHSAAWRDPDECERNKKAAHAINVSATDELAKIAKAKNAFFFFISTDYVFSGEQAPYKEDSPHCPVNYYGETKAEAENIVMKLAKFAILRIPILYGLAAGLAKSALLASTMNALHSKKTWDMEDSIVRFPTYTGDVAEAIFFILEKKLEGIFHFSGEDEKTRYKISLDFAEIFNLDASGIIRIPNPPASEARRPRNSHLSMDKILNHGFPHPIHFKERISMLKEEIIAQDEELRKNSN
jgi:dTDP-4-dehydrorhamnose reductase